MMSVFWTWHSFSCIAIGMAIGFLLSMGLLVPFDDRTLKFMTKAQNGKRQIFVKSFTDLIRLLQFSVTTDSYCCPDLLKIAETPRLL
jgi:hypothetical protein